MRIPPLARVLLAMAAAQWCACAQGHITVTVFDYVNAPHSEIAPAVETARRAFLAAGVESQWLVCRPGDCQTGRPANGLYLELFLMPRLVTQLTGHAARHLAGYAMTGPFVPPRGYAFYDSARTVADRTLRPMGVVLGCILIHEAGHLLGLDHQRSGVMRDHVEAADMDNALMGRAFNSEEKKELRREILLHSEAWERCARH